ncbi:MAG: 23S rRNA (guanosine(2251)-2'-O)-methyltransferase RlmB [Chlorobi bacterium]|nr:23S rRNA (guanosine(2251)-2'-O)-methyltransferase RlmB [Chlorobiota bacterium]
MKKIIGRKPVLEALNSGQEIDRIIISFGQKGNIIDSIRVAAKKRKVKITQLSPYKFKSYDKNQNTQGVVAIISDHKYWDAGDLIASAAQADKPLLLVLDSIQDTHNLGAILRTAESAGVAGVIITERNSASINETVEKTSAGAVSHLRIAKAANLRSAMEKIKEAGFWIVGTSLQGGKNYTEVDYSGATAIVMGNEEKGIRRLTAEQCDFLVKLPMKGKIQSLNVSVTAGIILYEVLRQRGA